VEERERKVHQTNEFDEAEKRSRRIEEEKAFHQTRLKRRKVEIGNSDVNWQKS
jgi:hypothetical protein